MSATDSLSLSSYNGLLCFNFCSTRINQITHEITVASDVFIFDAPIDINSNISSEVESCPMFVC